MSFISLQNGMNINNKSLDSFITGGSVCIYFIPTFNVDQIVLVSTQSCGHNDNGSDLLDHG